MLGRLTNIYWPAPAEGRELRAASGRILSAFCLMAALSGTIVNIVNLPYLDRFWAEMAVAQAIAFGFAGLPLLVNDQEDFARRALICCSGLMVFFILLSLSIGNVLSSTNILLLSAIAAVTLAVGWQFGLAATAIIVTVYLGNFAIELQGPASGITDPAVLVALICAAIIIFIGCTIYRREMQRAVRRIETQRIRAMEADRAKTDFLTVMSHEIRTPMNGVIGMLQLLSTADIPDQERDQAETALMSATSLLEILNNILDYSRNEAGASTMRPQPFDPASLLEEVIALFTPLADSKHIALELDGARALSRCVITDPDALRRIVTNLINNAIKFTQQGHVRVGVREMRKADNTCCLRIEVEDTGIGIPNDRLDEIFESFRQLEDTITRSHGGTGLGLAICRQLADLLDGEIGVQSKLGAGSCFWLEVPFTLPHQEALPEQTLLNAGD